MTKAKEHAVKKILDMLFLPQEQAQAITLQYTKLTVEELLEQFYINHSIERLKDLLKTDEGMSDKVKEIIKHAEEQDMMIRDIENGGNFGGTD